MIDSVDEYLENVPCMGYGIFSHCEPFLGLRRLVRSLCLYHWDLTLNISSDNSTVLPTYLNLPL